MNSVIAAVTKARSFLAFVGVLSLFGLDWTTWTRVVVGLALALVVAMESSADGHRIWPRHLKRPTRYDITA
jgi:hypothetical protein